MYFKTNKKAQADKKILHDLCDGVSIFISSVSIAELNRLSRLERIAGNDVMISWILCCTVVTPSLDKACLQRISDSSWSPSSSLGTRYVNPVFPSKP
jgi:hypothetical protein